MLTTRPRQSGVTLIELMIGLALVGLLGLMAVPAYQHWTRNAQIRNAAEGVLNGMQVARAEAVRRNVPVEISIDATGNWSIVLSGTATVVQTKEGNEGSRDAALTFQPVGSDRVTYSGMGWLTANNNGTDAITQIDVTSASYTGDELRPMRIIVSTGGAVKMCDPKVGSGDPRAC
jgi:type IV fimbrial biogenesis protein FimT